MPRSAPAAKAALHREITLEDHVVERLVAGGYRQRQPVDYDRTVALDRGMLCEYLRTSQPEAWAALEKQYAPKAEENLVRCVVESLASVGTLATLRNELRMVPDIRFRLCEFRPASGLTPAIEKRYQANILTVIRQLRYSQKNENALDIGLFVNGIPVATAELKNELTGSTTKTAEYQYRHDRAPAGEPLLTFQRGALVHFAVDERHVSMTTELANGKTEFLPFNKGRDGGKGNPDPASGEFATSYLWDYVWQRDSWLDIIQRFMHLEVKKEVDDDGKERERRRLIFPRWHQLEAVRMLVADAREKGAGQTYLIQHSAGSGKSNTIAWTSHRLATLFGAESKPVFDSVIVVTDRLVLDRQLQDTIKQFEQQPGLVTKIDGTSKQLADALKKGARIIVTTIQKFSTDHLEALRKQGQRKGSRFAIIVDEAHSGQSGDTADALHSVLSQGDGDSGGIEAVIASAQKARGPQPNISYLAFTATPRNVTLERFGRKDDKGDPKPFHLYSMRQAIEEGFILDVLANYMPYETFFTIEKVIADDPLFEGRRGAQRIARFVSLDPHQIAQKVEVVVEHFRKNIRWRLDGKAKAMVVTSSREAAVRWFYAMRDYIKERRHTDVQALVAFSGSLSIDGTDPVTEPMLNGVSEKGLPAAFNGPDFNVLLVAERYQTGFDQPKLVAMYVDKKLAGLQAVQTLSRLNRTRRGKDEVFVLDFRNTADEIQEAFKPFYEVTALAATTDPNQIYTLRSRLLGFHFVDENDVRRFAEVLFNDEADSKKRPELESLARETVARYEAVTDEKVQDEFRQLGRSFCRFYTFVAQVWPLRDTDLEKLHAYMTWVNRLIRDPDGDDSPEVTSDMVRLTAFKLKGGDVVNASLKAGDGVALPPISDFGANRWTEEERRTLSEIIDAFNTRHGLDIGPDDVVVLERADEEVRADPKMKAIIDHNSRDIALREFGERFADVAAEIFERDRNFANAFMKDAKVREQLAALFFDRAARVGEEKRRPS